ncbi:MAG TPA: tRNA (guanosine(37)-N1)-methyltransferase TrmD [Firmicutes bacterium]|nr:tRNA (guanosine(37)-N1)-methyltransferase TrmD [Bacillota bacterium]
MRIDVITLFPELFTSPLATSIVGRARDAGLADIEAHDLRRWASDERGTVDDAPYGGGGGMVLLPEPLTNAITELKAARTEPVYTVYLAPDGERLTQSLVNELALEQRLILVAGHYRGIDERVRTTMIDREVSIGDYVLSGGELPALVLIDAVVRLLPGALGNFESALEDSFQDDLLDCPWYTRPREFAGMAVPDVLLSGDREAIRRWRREQALLRTRERRPDLLARRNGSARD